MRVTVFIIAFILFIPASRADYTAAVDTADEILGLTDQERKIIKDEAEYIENQIEQINPDIVKENKDRPIDEKVAVYRHYLAQKAYEYYEQWFKERLERRSSETGRAIKSENYKKDGTLFWLERGELDEPKCNPKKRGSPCPYPDGFEDVVFNNDYGNLRFREDNKAENKTFWVSVLFRNKRDIDNNDVHQDIRLDTYYTEFDYTKYRDYKEAERAYLSWLNSASKKEKSSEEIKKTFDIPENNGVRFVTGRNTSFRSSHTVKEVDDD